MLPKAGPRASGPRSIAIRARLSTATIPFRRIGAAASPLAGSLVPQRGAAPQRSLVRVADRRGSGIDIADRTIAALPYIVPLVDGLRYSKFLVLQFPIFRSESMMQSGAGVSPPCGPTQCALGRSRLVPTHPLHP